MRGCLLRTAVACVGCCTPLLYGMTAASKNPVEGDIDPLLVRYAPCCRKLSLAWAYTYPLVGRSRCGSRRVVVRHGGQPRRVPARPSPAASQLRFQVRQHAVLNGYRIAQFGFGQDLYGLKPPTVSLF